MAEGQLLGLGLNVALKGISWFLKAFKDEKEVKAVVLKKLRRARRGEDKKKGHITFLCIPTGCGKSTLARKFGCSDVDGEDDVLLLDIDSLKKSLKPSDIKVIEEYKESGDTSAEMISSYPVIKAYLEQKKQEFPNNRKIILSNDIKLAKYLECDDVVAVLPNTTFIMEVLKHQETEEDKQRIFRQWGNALKSQLNPTLFDSWDDLEATIRKSFNLTPKL